MASDITLYNPTWVGSLGPSNNWNGVQFTGSGSAGIAAPGAPVYLGNYSASFTWCYWLRIDNLGQGGCYAFGKGNGAHSGNDFGVFFNFSTPNLAWYDPGFSTQATVSITDTNLHFHCWYADSGTLYLEIDGSPVWSTASYSLGDSEGGTDAYGLYLAGENISNANCQCTITQMRTYSVALGSTDRATLAGGGEVATNRMGLWDFREGSGSTAANWNGTDHILGGTYNASISNGSPSIKIANTLSANYGAALSNGSPRLGIPWNLGGNFAASLANTATLNEQIQFAGSAAASAGFTGNLRGGTVVGGNRILSPHRIF